MTEEQKNLAPDAPEAPVEAPVEAAEESPIPAERVESPDSESSPTPDTPEESIEPEAPAEPEPAEPEAPPAPDAPEVPVDIEPEITEAPELSVGALDGATVEALSSGDFFAWAKAGFIATLNVVDIENTGERRDAFLAAGRTTDSARADIALARAFFTVQLAYAEACDLEAVADEAKAYLSKVDALVAWLGIRA